MMTSWRSLGISSCPVGDASVIVLLDQGWVVPREDTKIRFWRSIFTYIDVIIYIVIFG